MPKVITIKRKAAGHRVYICQVCGEPVQPGEVYHTWKFNRGARYWQHKKCGFPKRSMLTNSKMGTVYDAVDSFDVSAVESTDEIKELLAQVAEAARSVAEEYGESADTIEDSWPSGTPVSEACRATSEELHSYADTLENWEPSQEKPEMDEADGDEQEYNETVEDWLQHMRDEASDLVVEHPEYQG